MRLLPKDVRQIYHVKLSLIRSSDREKALLPPRFLFVMFWHTRGRGPCRWPPGTLSSSKIPLRAKCPGCSFLVKYETIELVLQWSPLNIAHQPPKGTSDRVTEQPLGDHGQHSRIVLWQSVTTLSHLFTTKRWGRPNFSDHRAQQLVT